MGYLGTKPANQVIDSTLIADGTVTPSDLSTGAPYWSTLGNIGVGTTNPSSFGSTGKYITLSATEYPFFESKNSTAGSSYFGSNPTGGYIGTGGAYPLVFATNNTERMRIDSSGRVTMPYQPCFYAYGGPYQNTSNSVVQFTAAHTNRGSCYNTSNYRFTAPVTGAYAFHYAAMTDGSNYNRFYIRVNGSQAAGTMFASSDSYESFSGHWVLLLNANDYVDIFTGSETNIHPDYRTFSGYLLG